MRAYILQQEPVGLGTFRKAEDVKQRISFVKTEIDRISGHGVRKRQSRDKEEARIY